MRLEREHAPLAKNRLASLTEEKDLEKKKASLHTWYRAERRSSPLRGITLRSPYPSGQNKTFRILAYRPVLQ